jgi:hypothetical protein
MDWNQVSDWNLMVTASIFQHRGKTSAHASTLLKSVLRTWCQVFRTLSKTQNGSDFDVLPFLWKCKRNNECDNLKTFFVDCPLMLNPSLTVGWVKSPCSIYTVGLWCVELCLLKKYFNIRKSSCPAFSYHIKK